MTEPNKPAADGAKTTRPTGTAKADAAKAKTGTATSNDGVNPEMLANDANPEGKTDISTGPVGAPDVIDAQEHVLGDDPRRVKGQLAGGYHDSLTGASVDESGNFTEPGREGQGPIPKHRIVADAWPVEREKIDDRSKRVG